MNRNEIDCNILIEKFMASAAGSVMIKEKKKPNVVDKEEIQLVITHPEEKYVCKRNTWDYEFYQSLRKIKEIPMEYSFSEDPGFFYIQKKL